MGKNKIVSILVIEIVVNDMGKIILFAGQELNHLLNFFGYLRWFEFDIKYAFDVEVYADKERY